MTRYIDERTGHFIDTPNENSRALTQKQYASLNRVLPHVRVSRLLRMLPPTDTQRILK